MTTQTWTILTLLQWTEQFFQKKGLDSPRLDAELLLANCLKLTRVQLYTNFERPINEAELAQFKALIQRRANREPLAYITGEKDFFSLPFRIRPGVLIPRPETELIVELGISVIASPTGVAISPIRQKRLLHPAGFAMTDMPLYNDTIKILDIGTGSGCILISLLKNLASSTGIAMDVSPEAIACAQENAAFHGVLERIQWINRDFTNFDQPEFDHAFDLIVANLPYVSSDEIEGLMPEVAKFEPRKALVAKNHGLDLIFQLINRLRNWLKPTGKALLEIGATQGKACLEFISKNSYLQAKLHQDLAHHDRVLEIEIVQRDNCQT
ncbi:MAG: peptide chain release factor N(5)-glutamine methyltransferase [Deltaproteobacteria bacterium]|nr:peptide chain release factor N(5)-glutamine methyltransferase [Deltaproteobacteria bacterium]